MVEGVGKVDAEKITKPIQLLAAWLIGLILVDSAFLLAATRITSPEWAPGALVVASIVNVPLFLLALFLLQTRFRPEMQEDTFYAQYLEQKTKSVHTSRLSSPDALRRELTQQQAVARVLIHRTRRDLKALQHQVQGMRARPGADDTNEQSIAAISSKISEVQARFRTEARKLDWTRFSIDLNDLLPKYREVRKALVEGGVSVDSEFGSSNKDPIYPPERFQVSIGSGLKRAHVWRLVELLRPLGLELIEYDEDPRYAGKIIVGSYAFEMGVTGATVDDNLIEFLSSETTTTEAMVARLASGTD